MYTFYHRNAQNIFGSNIQIYGDIIKYITVTPHKIFANEYPKLLRTWFSDHLSLIGGTFNSMPQKGYQRKYLKYKQKYHNVKNIIM